MKKFLVFLLLLASSLWTTQTIFADDWKVTDTTIVDGYYRIHAWYNKAGSNYGDSIIGVFDMPSSVDATRAAAGLKVLFAKSTTTYAVANNWNFIWHLTRHADGTYTLKNCGTQAETYPYPDTDIGGQSNVMNAVGKEMVRFNIRTKDWGTISKRV